MKRVIFLATLASIHLNAQELQPTVGLKYTGGFSYDMEHEYISGEVGLQFTPKEEQILYSNIRLSGEYAYDFLNEKRYRTSLYVVRIQSSKEISNLVAITGSVGYMGVFKGQLMDPYNGAYRTNFSWAAGLQISDRTITGTIQYESLAGYPHLSIGVYFLLSDILK